MTSWVFQGESGAVVSSSRSARWANPTKRVLLRMSERIESNRLEAGQAGATTTFLDRMLSGLGVEPPLTADPIELPMQAFVRGCRVKVYDDPMTRERLQGWALLVEFINGCGWWKGFEVELWSVIFEDDDGTEVERSIWSAPEGVKK